MRQFFMGCLILAMVACSNDSAGGASSESEQNDQSADKGTQQAANPAQADLATLIERVVVPDDKRIIIASDVPASIAVGDWPEGKIDLAEFLTILGNNRLTAVEGDTLISVIPISQARRHARPLVDSDQDLPDDQWVSRIVFLENLDATIIVPVFRPAIAQEGQMSSIRGQNALLIVDRFANVNRVVELLETLERGAE